MSATYWTDLERYAALILPECIADCPNHDADYPGGCVSCNSRAERYAQAIVEEEAVVRDVEGLNRDDQIAGLMQDMVLSRVAKGLMLFSARKRLAEALVARGWRKGVMTDTARELAEALQPCRFTPDGWCGAHSTSVGPTYCTRLDEVDATAALAEVPSFLEEL